MDWQDITYLKTGNPRQQAAYDALAQARIFDVLREYDPVLVGTIPIGVDIEDSDLDIICYAPDLDAFDTLVHDHFHDADEFVTWRNNRGDGDYTVANFRAYGFIFELFAQDKPVKKQNAYRHMVIENRLLQLGDNKAREAIISLKQQGLKTEPAFAQYFKIQGADPYIALLKLDTYDECQLRKLMMS